MVGSYVGWQLTVTETFAFCFFKNNSVKIQPVIILTTRCYASAVYAVIVCPSVHSVRLSVHPSPRYCTKTAKRRITQTMPYDSPRTLSFLMPKISAKFQRCHPQRGRQIQVSRLQSAIFDQYFDISQRRCKIGT